MLSKYYRQVCNIVTNTPISVNTPATLRFGILYRCDKYLKEAAASPSEHKTRIYQHISTSITAYGTSPIAFSPLPPKIPYPNQIFRPLPV